MVCISCFIAPVLLFIWYKFVYPVVQPLLDRFFGNYQLPQPFANLSCPLPKKSVKSCSSESGKQKEDDGDQTDKSNEAASVSGDEKKDNWPKSVMATSNLVLHSSLTNFSGIICHSIIYSKFNF